MIASKQSCSHFRLTMLKISPQVMPATSHFSSFSSELASSLSFDKMTSELLKFKLTSSFRANLLASFKASIYKFIPKFRHSSSKKLTPSLDEI